MAILPDNRAIARLGKDGWAILGASLGLDAIPARWQEPVENREELVRIANGLTQVT